MMPCVIKTFERQYKNTLRLSQSHNKLNRSTTITTATATTTIGFLRKTGSPNCSIKLQIINVFCDRWAFLCTMLISFFPLFFFFAGCVCCVHCMCVCVCMFSSMKSAFWMFYVECCTNEVICIMKTKNIANCWAQLETHWMVHSWKKNKTNKQTNEQNKSRHKEITSTELA